jgi:hypothetical protein
VPMATYSKSAGTENGLLASTQEYDEGTEVRRASARNFHRRASAMPGHGLAARNALDAIRGSLAQLPRKHIERFGARMAMNRGLSSCRGARPIDTQEYLAAAIGGTGRISTILPEPGSEPAIGPRVNRQALPAHSAASDVGPSAACACLSVGKLRMLQNSGPAGNRSIVFSATGTTINPCCAAAGCGSNPATQNKRARVKIPKLRDMGQTWARHGPDMGQTWAISCINSRWSGRSSAVTSSAVNRTSGLR